MKKRSAQLVFVILTMLHLACKAAVPLTGTAAAKHLKEGSKPVQKKDDSTTHSPADTITPAKSSVNRDTTFLVLSDSQVDKILKAVKSNDTLSPEIKTLLSATIGALLTLLTQVLITSMGRKKERDKSRLKLLAEERRLAVLLVQFYKELAWLKVSRSFWFRYYVLDNTLNNEHYAQFLLFRDRIPECNRRINEVTAEYSKTVTHFMYLTKKNTHLIGLLKSMSTLKALESESSDFDSITNINLLQDESENESARLKAEYMKIGGILDQIYSEMEKSIPK